MNTETLWERPEVDPDLIETRHFPKLNRQSFAIDDTTAEAVCAVLEDLIEVARDGEEGFSHAAHYVTDRPLRDEFNQYSRERAQIVSELQRLERNYGKGDVDYSGSVMGAFHRAWMNIRTVVGSRNDQAILEEAERGEDAAVESFQKALKHEPPLPATVQSHLRALANKIQRAHDRVRDLRESNRYASKAA